MRESDIQKLILDYLSCRHILAFRMNSGAMKGSYKGRSWFVRFGTPGMADILSFPQNYPFPVWIEVKSDKGRMSEEQKSFQKLVEEQRHRYVLARSLDDVIRVVG